nr:hypothetical protein [Streptomyces sp. uw30]
MTGDLDEAAVRQRIIKVPGDAEQDGRAELPGDEERRGREAGESAEVVAEGVDGLDLPRPGRRHRRAPGPHGAAAELIDRLLRHLQEVARAQCERTVQVALGHGLFEGCDGIPSDGTVRRYRRLVEDEGRGEPVQGEAQGHEPAVGVAQQDRVRAGQVEDGGDVLLFALDAVVGGVTAGPVAAAVDRVGRQVRCEDIGQRLPVLGRVQGSGETTRGRPRPVTVTAMPSRLFEGRPGAVPPTGGRWGGVPFPEGATGPAGGEATAAAMASAKYPACSVDQDGDHNIESMYASIRCSRAMMEPCWN